MNEINIMIKGGLVHTIRADSVDIDVNVFDLDSDPDLIKEWEKKTARQKSYLYDARYLYYED